MHGGGSEQVVRRVLFMIEPLQNAGLFDRLMLALRRRSAFRVDGDSMLPTLAGGDIVIVKPGNTFSENDIVLARHPFRHDVKILKRICSISPDGSVHLVGDNPSESTDSRTFGAVSIESIIGRVTSRLK